MKTNVLIFGCLLLNCVVVHTCVRIEILNAYNGYYLPRTDFGGANPKWRVAAETMVRRQLDVDIAYERRIAFVAERPTEPVPDEAQFSGPPYSTSEHAMIDSVIDRNHSRSALRFWVSGMGVLQYVLAPIALVWTTYIARNTTSRKVTILASCGCLLDSVCIGLMFYRGYFTSLGW